jgi:hypothetical protein
MLVNSSGDSLPEIYVGEGESVLTRLKSHSKDAKKEFWEWAVIFVNRDNSLHKGHIQHIEASLVERAISNKRCILNNDVTPKKPSLPESVLFEAQDLLNDIYHVVPLLGISAFEMVVDDANGSTSESLIISSKGIRATGFATNSCIGLRDSLVQHGVLDNASYPWTFTQDFTFELPSMAASAV